MVSFDPDNSEVETGNPFLWMKQLRPRKLNPLAHHTGGGDGARF